jgi:hypothetical protein
MSVRVQFYFISLVMFYHILLLAVFRINIVNIEFRICSSICLVICFILWLMTERQRKKIVIMLHGIGV